jgi:secernin
MGANECNIVIGNEAVWTRELEGPPALLGMDLLRLALERSSTAIQAVHIICELLEEHGQGGACAEHDPGFTYHNSFLIVDPVEAWVLETAGQWWIAQQLTNGFRNISNGLSIQTEYTLCREGLVDHALDQGYCEDPSTFDFARCFSAGGYQKPSKYSREGWGQYLLHTHEGSLSPRSMMAILRDHSGGICMHGAIRTTASQVSYIAAEQSIHWFTGSPHPCLSFFKPFVVPARDHPRDLDIWEQRDQLDPRANQQAIQELQTLEHEMIRTIQQRAQPGNWSTEELQELTQEAIARELTVVSKTHG